MAEQEILSLHLILKIEMHMVEVLENINQKKGSD